MPHRRCISATQHPGLSVQALPSTLKSRVLAKATAIRLSVGLGKPCYVVATVIQLVLGLGNDKLWQALADVVDEGRRIRR
jgi:hypothetical protein